jgi:hypothetical protein
MGGQSGSGSSLSSKAGNQKRLNTSPMGVPGPTREISSLFSRESMAAKLLSQPDQRASLVCDAPRAEATVSLLGAFQERDTHSSSGVERQMSACVTIPHAVA